MKELSIELTDSIWSSPDEFKQEVENVRSLIIELLKNSTLEVESSKIGYAIEFLDLLASHEIKV